MNQVALYKQVLEIKEQIAAKQGEILNLRSKLKGLPYCPCCPSNTKGEICLIDFLRRKDANVESAAESFGISRDNLLAAVNCEYTLTEEEFGLRTIPSLLPRAIKLLDCLRQYTNE